MRLHTAQRRFSFRKTVAAVSLGDIAGSFHEAVLSVAQLAKDCRVTLEGSTERLEV